MKAKGKWTAQQLQINMQIPTLYRVNRESTWTNLPRKASGKRWHLSPEVKHQNELGRSWYQPKEIASAQALRGVWLEAIVVEVLVYTSREEVAWLWASRQTRVRWQKRSLVREWEDFKRSEWCVLLLTSCSLLFTF